MVGNSTASLLRSSPLKVGRDQPLVEMSPHRLRHLPVFRAADLIEFPCTVLRALDPCDGELVLVVDAVERVFAADDGIDEFLQAEVVIDGELEQFLRAVEVADGVGAGQRRAGAADGVADVGLEQVRGGQRGRNRRLGMVMRSGEFSECSMLAPPKNSPFGTDQFLDLVMVSKEEEHQFRRRGDEHKGQPVVQTDAALENRLGQPADTDAGVGVRPPPALEDPVDGIADFLTLGLRLGADLFQQIISDPCLQGGLRCLR